MNSKTWKKTISFLLFLALLMSVTGSVLAAKPSASFDVDYYSVHSDGTLECYVTWENIPKAKGFWLRILDGSDPEFEWASSYNAIRGSGKDYSAPAYMESAIPPFSTPYELITQLSHPI